MKPWSSVSSFSSGFTASGEKSDSSTSSRARGFPVFGSIARPASDTAFFAGAFFAAAFFAGIPSSLVGAAAAFVAAGAAFFTAAFLAAGSDTLALVLGAVLRAVAATARADSAGRFSDELDDTNYLSSDAGFLYGGTTVR